MALVGSIAINMSVRTAALVKGMKAAQKSVSDFGVRASASVSSFGSLMGDTGRAIGGVVNEFYIRPLSKLARFAGGVGGKMTKPFAGLGKLAGGGLMQMGGDMASMAMSTGKLGMAMGRLSLKATAKGFQSLGSAVGFAAKGVRSGLGVFTSFQSVMVGMATGGVLFKVTRAASSLAEQADRARVTFGDASKDIIQRAKLMGAAFGTTRSEFIEGASSMGAAFKGAGYEAADAAKLGVMFTERAMDMASAIQIPVADAMEKMQSGLSGELKAVKTWGADVGEVNLKVKMLAMGMKAVGGEFTEVQKKQARAAIIWDATAYAAGNLAKTAGGAENATKGFIGRINNLMEDIGTALLPMVASALVEMQVGIEALSMTWHSMTDGIVSDQIGVVGAVGETDGAMGMLQKSVGFVTDAFQTLKIVFMGVQAYITSKLSKITGTLSEISKGIDQAIQTATFGLAPKGIGEHVTFGMGGLGGASGITDAMDNISADLSKLGDEQYRKFQDEKKKPKASEGVDAAFKASRDRIAAMRTEAAKPGGKPTDFKPKDMTAAKPTETKFASASAFGSQEAANAVLRSRYGASAGGKGPEDVTAKNTGKLVTLFERAVGAGRRVGADVGGAGNIGEVIGALWKNF